MRIGSNRPAAAGRLTGRRKSGRLEKKQSLEVMQIGNWETEKGN